MHVRNLREPIGFTRTVRWGDLVIGFVASLLESVAECGGSTMNRTIIVAIRRPLYYTYCSEIHTVVLQYV